MRRSRRCRNDQRPRWIRIIETNTSQEGLGFTSFRIVGWRRPVLRAVRPWTWLHIVLLNRWGPRFHPSGPEGDGPPDVGVPEPRRPSPLADAGAAAVPLPEST